MKSIWHLMIALAMLLMPTLSIAAEDVRIKDLVNIRGVRSNQLIGFGLVVGLKNSGDSKKSLTTNRAIANLLTRLGIRADSEEVVSGSIAGVVATADLPAFSRNGDRIDVRISTIGDANSLAGGTLLLTPMHAGDNQVYVIAQGATVVGQANGAGAQVLTVATVPNGGSVEREFAPEFTNNGKMTLSLRTPDFTTNARIADRINGHFKGYYAKSLDPVSIDITVPPLFLKNGRTVEFISELEKLQVDPDTKAVVIVNERTGTVVMGSQVAVGEVTIAHGDLSIQVGKAKGPGKRVVNFEPTTVGKLVETLNTLGIKPADLVGILQAMNAAGALKAELKFM